MKTRAINPTAWLQHFGLNHAVEVTGASRTLYASGQAATGEDGTAMHPGDLVAQFTLAWKNLKDVLAAADMAANDIVRLNIYTTDVASFMENAEALIPIWAEDGAQPSCTLLEVAGLFDPELMVEIEATAVGG